ncbi:hypothetical protein [Hymenobacter sp. UV11]|uniref:hypothetical protein n=1 Tax=Hymenobacter sp. UV11 TaxID=1849735 RepID=UPI00105FD51A|nr:hypothetical protein [Hymenobacter sp. UV11]TDN39205.1 hypothetical protein A8B98_20145 [Hymenobacter sp. UV11]
MTLFLTGRGEFCELRPGWLRAPEWGGAPAGPFRLLPLLLPCWLCQPLSPGYAGCCPAGGPPPPPISAPARLLPALLPLPLALAPTAQAQPTTAYTGAAQPSGGR